MGPRTKACREPKGQPVEHGMSRGGRGLGRPEAGSNSEVTCALLNNHIGEQGWGSLHKTIMWSSRLTTIIICDCNGQSPSWS